MLDRQHSGVTDCTVSDITFDGQARVTPVGNSSKAQRGYFASRKADVMSGGDA